MPLHHVRRAGSLNAVFLVLLTSATAVSGSLTGAPAAQAAPAAPAPITGIKTPTTWTGSLLDPVATAYSHGQVWFADRGQDAGQQVESEGTIDRITTDGYVEGWDVGVDPTSITVGPDHNLWFGMDQGEIGRLSPATHVRRVFDTGAATPITAITAGPGGLWYVGGGGNTGADPFVGRITTAGKVTLIHPKTLIAPEGVSAAGGAVWILDDGGIGANGKRYPAGVLRVAFGQKVRRYTTTLLHALNSLRPMAITTGPDHALWIADGAILRLSTAGHWSGFGKVRGSAETSIIPGPHKTLWYLDGESHIGRITTGGHITRYTGNGVSLTLGAHHTLWAARGYPGGMERISLHSKARKIFRGGISDPVKLVSADHSLWFTDFGDGTIGRFVPGEGAIFYSNPKVSEPDGLVVGPDKALWFTDYGLNAIGRLSLTTHKITMYHGAHIGQPNAITVGPDKALWFTNEGNTTIGRVTVHGSVSHYAGGNLAIQDDAITTGPDGDIWYASNDQDLLFRMDPGTHHVTKLSDTFPGPTALLSSGGYVWVASEDELARVSTSGTVASRAAPAEGGNLSGLASDKRGRIWFTALPEECFQSVCPGGIGVRATPDHVFFRTANDYDAGADGIARGPDGAMWITSVYGGPGSISRVTTKS